ncbi:MAG TPA: hypothetical protein VGY58_15805 [Gemmataceae bacterium]|nr:hypothetical protein [Gemmataceae bacterium]
MFMRTARAGVALLLLAGMRDSTVFAKPPGLPVNQKDACLERAAPLEVHSEQVAENRPAAEAKPAKTAPAKSEPTVLIEITVDSDKGIFTGMAAGSAHARADTSCIEQLTDGWNFLRGYLDGDLGLLGVQLTAELPLDTSTSQQRAQQLTNQEEDLREIRKEWERIWFTDEPSHLTTASECPHMQGQARKTAAKEPAVGSVLENLQKLEQARKLYEQAETERKANRFENACQKYEAVQKLCPGSRLAHEASSRLTEVQTVTKPASTEAGTEEEENTPIAWWPRGVQVQGKARVAGLAMNLVLKGDGHGSVFFSLGAESAVGYPFYIWGKYQALAPLFSGAN